MMPIKTQIAAKAPSVSQSAIFYLLCAGFVLNGIVICLIGPILPVFRDKFGLDDSRAGLFSTMQFSFSLAGVLISSPLTAAKGFKPAITLGVAMLGIGFALLNAPTFALALAASAITVWATVLPRRERICGSANPMERAVPPLSTS